MKFGLQLASSFMGAPGLMNAFRPKYPNSLNPENMKNQLMYSDASLQAIRNQMLENIRTGSRGNVAALRQMGATGRMPMGAQTAGLQGIAYQGNRAMSDTEPQLQEMKRKGAMDYYGLKQNYEMGKYNAEMADYEDVAGDLGSMTKLAMLWQGGFFDTPGGGQQAQGQQQMQGYNPYRYGV